MCEKWNWMWRLAYLQWAEYNFNCGITGLRKAEKISMTMLVLVSRARQQPMKTLKHWRKWFWIIVQSLLEMLLIMLAYRLAYDKQFFPNFLDMKRAAKKIVPKFLNFKQKQCCTHIAQETIQICWKGHNWWLVHHGRMAMTLKSKLNNPNGSVQKSQHRKKHFKFGQM